MSSLAKVLRNKVIEIKNDPKNIIFYAGLISTVVLFIFGNMIPRLSMAKTIISVFMLAVGVPVMIYAIKKEHIINFSEIKADMKNIGLIGTGKAFFKKAQKAGIVPYIQCVFTFAGIIALLTFALNLVFADVRNFAVVVIAVVMLHIRKHVKSLITELINEIGIKKMKSIVNSNIIEHQGGERFFNSLDAMIRNDNILISMMISQVMKNEKFDFILVSGNFGRFFKKYCLFHLPTLYRKVIVVNGGQRKGNGVYTDYSNFKVSGKKIVFIDDSFYSGKTRNVIKESLEQNGATLLKTYVFYDGSKVVDNDVVSFYRYYN